jgi:hypothetical protein
MWTLAFWAPRRSHANAHSTRPGLAHLFYALAHREPSPLAPRFTLEDAADNFAVRPHVVIVIISARLIGEKPKHVTCAF